MKWTPILDTIFPIKKSMKLSTALINALTLNWTDHCELALRS